MLQPQFLRYGEEDGHTVFKHVDGIAEAQGVKFLCPKCFTANGGPVGTHAIICWSRERGVPDEARPAPGRWALRGGGYDDLTLDGDADLYGVVRSRSVQVLGGCAWHGFVTNGEVTDA